MNQVILTCCFILLGIIALVQSIRLELYKCLAEEQDRVLKEVDRVMNKYIKCTEDKTEEVKDNK